MTHPEQFLGVFDKKSYAIIEILDVTLEIIRRYLQQITSKVQ